MEVLSRFSWGWKCCTSGEAVWVTERREDAVG